MFGSHLMCVQMVVVRKAKNESTKLNTGIQPFENSQMQTNHHRIEARMDARGHGERWNGAGCI